MTNFIYNFLVGSGFGFALQKARVFDPSVIQGQLLLTDFTMVQAFLAGLGTSQIAIGLAYFSPFASKFIAIQNAYCKRSLGKVSAILGGLILGAGMALSGACPGTFYAQLGSGVPGASFVLGGAAVGVLIHALIDEWVQKNLNPLLRNNQKLLGNSFPFVSIFTGAAMMIASIAIGKTLPTSSIEGVSGLNPLSLKAWSPQVAGAMIGLMQIPSIILLKAPMGMSSALVAIVSPLAYPLKWLGLVSKDSEVLKSISGWVTKFIYVAGCIGGAYFSAQMSQSFSSSVGLINIASSDTLPKVYSLFGSGEIQAFIGGVLLWLGARIGGGCTSGHGISGSSFMNANSLLAVPAMFAGGILTSLLLNTF